MEVQEMVTCPGESLTDAGTDELLDWMYGMTPLAMPVAIPVLKRSLKIK